MTRQEFIDMISGGMPGMPLSRFEASVLTVQPAAGGGWSAVITSSEVIGACRRGVTGAPLPLADRD